MNDLCIILALIHMMIVAHMDIVAAHRSRESTLFWYYIPILLGDVSFEAALLNLGGIHFGTQISPWIFLASSLLLMGASKRQVKKAITCVEL